MIEKEISYKLTLTEKQALELLTLMEASKHLGGFQESQELFDVYDSLKRVLYDET